MVQRKVPNKLGIQADHIKSEKLLVNLKPSFCQHHDGKNKGGAAELKKKMKKSRPIKLMDLETLQSPNLRPQVPQPGKPPTVVVPTAAATPQKPSPIKPSNTAPNYMKSTSSFDARKERFPVSTRTPQVCSDSKSPAKKNSNHIKLSSASGNKPARSLARTSSLKLVRALTKTTSFKPTRAPTKKCSPVVLCENLDVQRATCSSTLKDSKFPPYLTLNSGGTELEGTSAMKVCPYTYCSLNGHQHPPLPPLKCFLSARRRMLKTQKSIKFGCLSPCRARPTGKEMKEIGAWKVMFDEKPATEEFDLNSSMITPLIQEENADFFIEIYGKEWKDKNDEQDPTEFCADGVMPSVGGCDEIASESYNGVGESCSDEDPCSEIDYEENLDQKSDIFSSGMDIAELFPEEVQNPEADVYPRPMTPEKTSVEADEPDKEASDMEWEAEQYTVPYLDDRADNIIQFNIGSYLEKVKSLEFENCTCHEESIQQSDDSCFDEILADEMLHEFSDEESVSSEAWSGDNEPESDASYKMSGSERDGDSKPHKSVDTGITAAPVEKLTEELRESSEYTNGVSQADGEITIMDLQLGDDKTECTISTEDAALISQENESLQVDAATAFLRNQELPHCCDVTRPAQNEPYKKYITLENLFTVFVLLFTTADKRMEPKEQAHAAKSSVGVQTDAEEGMEEREQVDAARVSVRVQTEPEEGIEENKQVDAGNVLVGVQTYAEEGRVEREQADAPKSLVGVQTDAEEGMEEYEQVDAPKLSVGVQTDAEEGMEEKEQVDAAKSSAGVQSDIWQGSSEAVQATIGTNDERQLHVIAKDSESYQYSADEGLAGETQDHSSDRQSHSNHIVGDQNQLKEDRDEADNFEASNSMDPKDRKHSGINILNSPETQKDCLYNMETEHTVNADEEETQSIAQALDASCTQTKDAICNLASNSNQLHETSKNSKGTIRGKRPIEECEEPREFNPRDPNYLPVELGPEAEMVDLRHQMMADRKNSEEWMIDYALQQAVTKLVPARKRKVALLVEAFETVLPEPKFEFHLKHTSPAFSHARPIQACN